MSLSLLISLFLNLATASPNPGMGASPLSQKFVDQWQTIEGIGFTAKASDWKIDNLEEITEDLKTPFRLVSKKSSQASLAFHTDKLKRNQNIESYIKHWVKEYQYFGFEILKTSPATILGQKGFVIDLFHKKNQKQVRQFLAQNSGATLIMTCTDEVANFKTTVAQCHEVYRTLKWRLPPRTNTP